MSWVLGLWLGPEDFGAWVGDGEFRGMGETCGIWGLKLGLVGYGA